MGVVTCGNSTKRLVTAVSRLSSSHSFTPILRRLCHARVTGNRSLTPKPRYPGPPCSRIVPSGTFSDSFPAPDMLGTYALNASGGQEGCDVTTPFEVVDMLPTTTTTATTTTTTT